MTTRTPTRLFKDKIDFVYKSFQKPRKVWFSYITDFRQIKLKEIFILTYIFCYRNEDLPNPTSLFLFNEPLVICLS